MPRLSSLALLSALFAARALAQDFSDPADLLTYLHRRNAPVDPTKLPEVDGTLEAATTAKPGWYGLTLTLDGGKEYHVIVAPSTSFYKDYNPLDAAAAYQQLVPGAKIRLHHDPNQDLALHTVVVTHLMFESPPVEIDGTIKAAASSQPGTYDLTLTLDKGERHLVIDPQTKFWLNDKPFPAKDAYPRLSSGQKIRALEKPAPGNHKVISDVMLVDR